MHTIIIIIIIIMRLETTDAKGTKKTRTKTMMSTKIIKE